MSHRPSILVIDSRDRLTSSPSTSDFIIQLPQAIKDCRKIELLSASIPATIYNVDSSNNKIYFNDGGNKTATITSGAYTSLTLPTAIKTAMDAVSAINFTVSYSETTFKITITGDAPYSLMFGTFTTDSIASTLGYRDVDTVAGLSHTGNDCLDLANPDFYYIDIIELFRNVVSTNPIDHSTFVIVSKTLSDGSQELFTAGADYNQIELFPDTTLYNLHIRLKNRNNKIVNLNGSNFNFFLRMIY